MTAGNASGIVDGAAALVVRLGPRRASGRLDAAGRIVAWAIVGVDPAIMGIGPAPAIRKALRARRAGARRHRPVRDQRGVRGPVPGGREGARPRPREGERQRRRDRPRPPAGRHRHAADAHAAARAAARGGKRYGIASACIGGGQGIAVIVGSRCERMSSIAIRRRPPAGSQKGKSSRPCDPTGGTVMKTVGVLGCGLMGAGIAQVAAQSGFTGPSSARWTRRRARQGPRAHPQVPGRRGRQEGRRRWRRRTRSTRRT